MTTSACSRSQVLRFALAARLESLAPHLLGRAHPLSEEPTLEDTSALLDELIAVAADGPDPAVLWALVAGVCAAYPTREELDHVRRRLDLSESRVRTLAFLEATQALASVGDQTARMRVLSGAVLIDVDHTAKNDLHTGIQSVVRSLLPIWSSDFDVVPVAWNLRSTVLRELTPGESDRAVRWRARTQHAGATGATDEGGLFLLPWRSVLVLIEVRGGEIADRLAGVGDRSGNVVVGVVHDMIPAVSADMVLPYVASDFAHYLTALKFTRRLAGVSVSAAEEFGGFVEALPSQGLTGPEVIAVSLPTPPTARRAARANSSPGSEPARVLVVGSHEPRKNHLAVLHAAETLWRESVDFSLLFIGGGGWGESFPQRVNELRAAGRDVSVRQAVGDGELQFSYREADLTVFPSLHEGFGLPIAESLSHGTPVIASDFGPMTETAAAGGVLLVDPRDDRAITDALRSLLTQPDRLAALRDDIHARPGRDWQTYAHELWDRLIVPELSELGA